MITITKAAERGEEAAKDALREIEDRIQRGQFPGAK